MATQILSDNRARLEELDKAPAVYATIYRESYSLSDAIHFCVNFALKEGHGIKIKSWTNGISYISKIKKQYPDLTILDISNVNWQYLCLPDKSVDFLIRHGAKVIRSTNSHKL